MNQVFDLPIEEYVYLSGKPPAKDNNLEPPQDQAATPTAKQDRSPLITQS